MNPHTWLSGVDRYYHTVRYLRPVQIYGRVLRHLRTPRLELGPAPPIRAGNAAWVIPARRQPSMIAPMNFRFLNEEHSVRTLSDWDNPAWSKLWRYNLHYFDDLNGWNATECRSWHRELLARWVRENPPARGSGWEPYPISLRIVNWIKWALAGSRLESGELHSLVVQVRYLRRCLERHLLGNHLFANAKALVFAGLFFAGGEAEGWLEEGLAILDRELAEQVLPDGGHFERSPMYHALALEDLLDLFNLGRCRDGVGVARLDRWGARIEAMRLWLQVMSHPDGGIAFFNDAALGIAPANRELDRYARELGFGHLPPPADGLCHLQDSGYIRLQQGATVAILDVAPVGPDYLPGHAHADTLSFELSHGGRRIVVNGGTSGYGTGPDRQRERGTAAHSTVEVDGQDSSEVWAGFRVARRAHPLDLAVARMDTGWTIHCAHDGYQRLPGKPIHRREWRFDAQQLRVSDAVIGTHRRAVARFHLHPDIVPESVVDGWRLAPGVEVRIAGGSPRLADSLHAPEFGLIRPSRVLEVELSRRESSALFHFADAVGSSSGLTTPRAFATSG